MTPLVSVHPSLLSIPVGAWGVAVSGGADSVALLSLLRDRSDLQLVVIHLDHQTRAGQSAIDAQFVAALSARLGLPFAGATLSETEKSMHRLKRPRNASARFRAARFAWFRRVVQERSLQGVILAHHADDQAETVLLRLLRGSDISGLGAMRPVTRIGTLTVLRPLLGFRRDALRAHLAEHQVAWREDATNASPIYRRSIARRLLAKHSSLSVPLLVLAEAATKWGAWIRDNSPALDETFQAVKLREMPPLLAPEAARRWLVERGAPPGELSRGVLKRLIEMASDAAAPARAHFPGALRIRRRAGSIFVDHSS